MSMRSHTLVVLVAGVVIGFSGALATGVLAERQATSPGARSGDALPWQDANLFAEVYERIKLDYVDEENDHKLTENAIRGMVGGLDPHSAFLDNQEFEQIRLSTMGSYPGVGIEVAADGRAVKILHPIEGSPAALAGIKAGDLISQIDGVPVGSDAAGAIERMRGEAGTTVRLTIRRPSTGEVRFYALRRAEVAVHSVAQQTLAPGYGYVRITEFSETTPQDLDTAVAVLGRDNPAGLKGLVLDLRNNPGGVLESGVAVADAFLDHGVIVTADGRTPDARFRMDATPGDVLHGAPMVVLVDGGTASAAEIVAGALKDHGRAEIIGERTYGKGTVQTVMPLSRGALKLTTSRYFTPSGVSIDGKGILPDLIVEHAGEPVDLDEGGAPLARRDAEVRIALHALRTGIPRGRARDLALAMAPVP
jgi:carboxyl-terminal processing protease